MELSEPYFFRLLLFLRIFLFFSAGNLTSLTTEQKSQLKKIVILKSDLGLPC